MKLNIRIIKIIRTFLMAFIVLSSWGAFAESGVSECQVSQSELLRANSVGFDVDIDSFIKYSNDCSNTLLNQFLLSIEKLKAVKFNEVPKSIRNEITDALKDPWQFLLTRYFTRFAFEPSGSRVAAYSAFDGTITLSNHFFERDIVEQLSTLIHEAQHSDVTTPWHETCYKGQLIGAPGACDGVISTELKIAGSYVVEYWFLKLVVHTKSDLFSKASKEAALLRTKELVAHRFNHVHDHAHNNDLVVVLTEDNLLKVFDPITQVFKIIEKPFSSKVSKIKKNYRNEGFYIITDDGELFNWGPSYFGFKNIDHYNISKFQGKIKDFFRVLHPEYKINRNLLVTTDNKYYLEGINDQLEKEYKLIEKEDFLSSFLLNSHNQVVLKPNKKVEFHDPIFGHIKLKADTAPEEINYIFPTHYGYYFYGISGSGEVYFAKILRQILPGNMGATPMEILYTRDEFQTYPNSIAIKVEEGGSYRAILDNQGALHLSLHDERLKTEVPQKHAQSKVVNTHFKVKDFTLVRKTVQVHDLDLESSSKNAFKRKCAVANVELDPWLNRPIGINANNNLVMYEFGGCKALYDNVVSFEFKSKGSQYNPYGYNTSELWLRLIDGSEILYPTKL